MKSVTSLVKEYKALQLSNVVNYDKFNQFAITAHSTQIEGATLTLEETSLLIDEGITPKGKPLEHALMVRDHHHALQLAIKNGMEEKPITVRSICELNAAVMSGTGQTYHTTLGTVDAKQGELRKGAVLVGKRYFPSYDKVPALLEKLCMELNQRLVEATSIKEKLEVSYGAHFNLVSIHPHYDGNGRTSRLLMNQIQTRFNLPLGCVYKEDKKEYFESLEKSRETENIDPFNKFMDSQYKKYLSKEIANYSSQNVTNEKGSGMKFLF